MGQKRESTRYSLDSEIFILTNMLLLDPGHIFYIWMPTSGEMAGLPTDKASKTRLITKEAQVKKYTILHMQIPPQTPTIAPLYRVPLASFL